MFSKNGWLLLVITILFLSSCSGETGDIVEKQRLIQDSTQLVSIDITKEPEKSHAGSYESGYVIFYTGHYDSDLDAVLFDKALLDKVDFSASQCGAPDKKGLEIVANLGKHSMVSWAEEWSPKGDIIGTAIMNPDNCNYEVIWAGELPESSEIIDFEVFVEDGHIEDDILLFNQNNVAPFDIHDVQVLGCDGYPPDLSVSDTLIGVFSTINGSEKLLWISVFECEEIYSQQ